MKKGDYQLSPLFQDVQMYKSISKFQTLIVHFSTAEYNGSLRNTGARVIAGFFVTCHGGEKKPTRQYMDLTVILDRIYPLPASSKQMLIDCTNETTCKKGQILLRADRVEKTIYFIKTGVVRAFAPFDGQDVTFWFGEEGETILSIKSYVENEKGYENIELLSDCVLYELETTDLDTLYRRDVHIANWGRKLAEKEWLKLESRMLSSALLSATERYNRLVAEFPGLIQQVPLKHIASYLGITQVSLSRIRKER